MPDMFPTLPGISIEVIRAPFFVNSVEEGESGLEARMSWMPTPRWRYQLRMEFLRSDAIYQELATLEQFIESHTGQLSNFYIQDPYDGTQVLVRFNQDEFKMERIVNGVWEQKTLDLVSVT